MRVLVTAASRHGSTREIAQEIAQEIRAAGLECDQLEPKEISSVADYDCVIVGSAIYVGNWMAEARDLLDRTRVELLDRKVWLFSSGLSDTPSKEANSTPALFARMKDVGAVEHRHFSGKLDVLALSLAERAAIMAARGKYGDARDMEAVHGWASQIAQRIGAQHPAQVD
ncbi:flavodoxin domain-containing protein [Jonesiaceae bacterium BS-20]|uniref:Flavodoxin domain-containing protein n=1 Tax=Jonesiaceae bacterium BS-20 TaxID=3120821 RepID=A0AAU7DS88_9MICO